MKRKKTKSLKSRCNWLARDNSHQIRRLSCSITHTKTWTRWSQRLSLNRRSLRWKSWRSTTIAVPVTEWWAHLTAPAWCLSSKTSCLTMSPSRITIWTTTIASSEDSWTTTTIRVTNTTQTPRSKCFRLKTRRRETEMTTSTTVKTITTRTRLLACSAGETSAM